MKKRIIGFSLGITICIVIIVIFSILVGNSGGAPLNIDKNIRDFFYFIRGEEKNFLFYVFRVITELGDIYCTILLGIIVLILTKADNKFFAFVLGLLLMLLFNMALKDIFQRERPYEELRWVTEKSYSFPSGHSTTIGFIITYMVYFVFDSNVRKKLKIILYIILGISAFVVPMTRMYFGVHYFSDIAAGLASGAFVGLLMIIFTLVMKKLGIYEEPLLVTFTNYIKSRKEEKNKKIESEVLENQEENKEE